MTSISLLKGSIGRRWLKEVLTYALSVLGASCLGGGTLCLGFYALAKADQRFAGAAAVETFQQRRGEALAWPPDQTLWSANRRAAYDESLVAGIASPSALLHIPSLQLLVPIFPGTDEIALNRGIGWIEGTATPGTPGNVGLAGHRDGFFRGLKDIGIGDSIELQTVDASFLYRVTEVSVVDPTDVSVLDPSAQGSVTLVTCYPFYFVGHAPQRFIVRGVLDES